MSIAITLLQLGLAFIFAFAGIDALREPAAWIGFLPGTLPFHFSAALFLDLLSYGQILLALVLLWRPGAAYAAIIATALLLGITLISFNAFLVTFRDLGLAFMALALICLSWPERYRRT